MGLNCLIQAAITIQVRRIRLQLYVDITNSAPILNESVLRNEFKPEKKGFFAKVGGFFGSVKETIKEAKLGDKLKETGEKAMVVAKKAGTFVAEKGKEAYVNTSI